MDGGDLATWAAVAVALGISVKDSVERQFERRARHLLNGAQILPDVGRLRGAIQRQIDQARTALRDSSDLSVLESECAGFQSMYLAIGLAGYRGQIDQVGALPEELLIPLAKALTLIRLLVENGAIRLEQYGQTERDAVASDLREWIEQSESIDGSLALVEAGIHRQMSSRLWKRHRSSWLE